MTLQELIACLPLKLTPVPFDRHLLGAFRRKSITFATGATDESTMVYWFQSAGFTIDLRLTQGGATPLTQRQGWIGDTVWDDATQLLSWEIETSYQPRNQWPEPARLHAIGNAVVEFAPSGAYVEDWRQQATDGPLLGLRLTGMLDEITGASVAIDGGLVVAGEHVAFACGRHPDVETRLRSCDDLDMALASGAVTPTEVESYEVSVARSGEIVTHSTQPSRVDAAIVGNRFEVEEDGSVALVRQIGGRTCRLRFVVDHFDPACAFGNDTPMTAEATAWMAREREHLTANALVCR